MNHVSAASDESLIFVVCAPSASHPHSQRSPTPGPGRHRSQNPASTSHRPDSPSLCWYHLNHADQAQNSCALCSDAAKVLDLIRAPPAIDPY